METVRALEDVYTLRWNKYQESLSSGLQGLLLDKDLVDVTLVCDAGEFVKAHKVVLAASSIYFRKMFTENMCKHPIVMMPDVKMFHLHSILEFIYTGQVNVNEKDIMDFLNTSEMLKIHGLTLMLHDEKDKEAMMLVNEEPINLETAGIEEVVTTLPAAELQLNEGLDNNSEVPRKRRKTCKPNQDITFLSDQPVVKSKVKVLAEPIPQLPCESLDQPVTKQSTVKSFNKTPTKPVQVPKCSNIPSDLIYPPSDPLTPLDPNNSESVRRSIRKRKRSVRAPSPESILRGSSSFSFISHVPLLLGDDDPPVAIKTEPVQDENTESLDLLDRTMAKGIKEEPLDVQDACDTSSSPYVKMERLKLPPKPRPNLICLQGLRITKSSITGRFKCPLCSKTYSHKSHVERHYKIIHSKNYTENAAQLSQIRNIKKYYCPHCSKTFDRRSLVERHMLRKHKGEEVPPASEKLQGGEVKRYSCPYCIKKFLHLSSRGRHISQNHEELAHKIEYTCPKCSRIFTRRNHFRNHVKKCGHSDDSGALEMSFFEHEAITHISKARKNKPKVKIGCSSTSVTNIKNLKVEDFGDEKSIGGYKCPYCSKIYNYQSHVYRHVNNIHGKYSHAVTCKLCKRVTQNLNSLKVHYYVSHPGREIKIAEYYKTTD